jgi:hypothetical protein
MEFEPGGRRSGQTKSDFDLLSFPRRVPPPRVHAYQTPEGSLVHAVDFDWGELAAFRLTWLKYVPLEKSEC